MDQATLDGCTAKADRAELQAEAVADEWRVFRESNPYPSRVKVDEQTGWNRVYFDFSTPSSPSIPVIVGEFAHDLRSALDHLAWREVTEFLTREPTKNEGRIIAFPIAKRASDFQSSQTRPYVSKDTWAVMERHQPYERPKGSALSLLHWFNREDKHRTLQITSVIFLQPLGFPPDFLSWNPDALVREVDQIEVYTTLEGEANVMSVRFDPSGPEPQMRVQRTPDLAIGFRDLPEPLRGITLEDTLEEVRSVIADFASLLPQRPCHP